MRSGPGSSRSVLLAAIALAVFLFNVDRSVRVPYDLIARTNVTGLYTDAAVRYRGLGVGKVQSIKFDRDHPGQILIRISSTSTRRSRIPPSAARLPGRDGHRVRAARRYRARSRAAAVVGEACRAAADAPGPASTSCSSAATSCCASSNASPTTRTNSCRRRHARPVAGDRGRACKARPTASRR